MKRVLLFFTVICLVIQVGKNPTWAKPAEGASGQYEYFGYADTNSDCIVDVLDEQSMAFRYGSSFSLPFYNTWYDVEPYAKTGKYDWDIDIKDLQFVFGRDGHHCVNWYEPEAVMGLYSLASDSEQACKAVKLNVRDSTARFTKISSSYYVDPVTVVFTGNATPTHLENWAQSHGFPVLDHDGEQRFWEGGVCSYEDVDAAENEGGCIPPPFGDCLGLPELVSLWMLGASSS